MTAAPTNAAPAGPVPWFVLVNPASGRGRAGRRIDEARRLFVRHGLPAEFALTRARGHAVDLTVSALRSGHRRIAAMGGDGTLNEVVNGLLGQSEVPVAQVALAALPVGTGNDWARSLGMPRALADAVAALASRSPVRCDAGRLVFTDADGAERRRFFANVAGAGFDALVLERLGDRKAGAWAYTGELLRSMRRFEAPTLTLRDGARESARSSLVVFCNLGRYCGGGMQVAPAADLRDGRLDVTWIEAMTGRQILWELRRLFDGTLGGSRHVTQWATPTLAIASDRPTGVEVDGELVGRTPARVEVLPGALSVIAPALG